jgi:hypothetical protein
LRFTRLLPREGADYFFANGSKPNFWPPTLASAGNLAPSEPGRPPRGEDAYDRNFASLLGLGGERRGERPGQRGQHEAAAVHYSIT